MSCVVRFHLHRFQPISLRTYTHSNDFKNTITRLAQDIKWSNADHTWHIVLKRGPTAPCLHIVIQVRRLCAKPSFSWFTHHAVVVIWKRRSRHTDRLTELIPRVANLWQHYICKDRCRSASRGAICAENPFGFFATYRCWTGADTRPCGSHMTYRFHKESRSYKFIDRMCLRPIRIGQISHIIHTSQRRLKTLKQAHRPLDTTNTTEWETLTTLCRQGQAQISILICHKY